MERKVSLDDKSQEMIEMLADVFDDLQTALEPIRDKALDERARLVGYAQCAEQMIKIIADQVAGLRALAKRKETEARNPVDAATPAAPTPKAVGAAVPKNGRSRMKTAVPKEATRGGDHSA